MARRNHSGLRSQSPTASDLLKKALAQPGVEAVLEVYRGWERVEKTIRPYSQFMRGTPHFTVSNSSQPTSW